MSTGSNRRDTEIIHAVQWKSIVQVAVCSFNDKEKLSNGKYCLTICNKNLFTLANSYESANGIVIIRLGYPSPISRPHNNHFMFKLYPVRL